jgi:hypothetical protein
LAVLDEGPAGALIVALGGDHGIHLARAAVGAALEDAGANVRAGQRGRVRLGVFAAQRHQSRGVIEMMVRKDHVGNIGEIDVQLAGVAQYGVRMRAGIEENAVAVRDHQRREAPFAVALVGRQHGGEQTHIEGATLSAAEQASAAASKQAINAVRLNIACYVNTIEEGRYAAHESLLWLALVAASP